MSKKVGSKAFKIASRLKGLLSVTETFDRGNGGLGFGGGSGSVAWKATRGSWGISANKASSSDAANSYPIATLTFTKTDVTIGVEGGAGTGTAFWVTDSNNWWGTYVDATQTCQTCYNVSNVATYNSSTTYVPASGGNCSSANYPCSYYNMGNWTGSYYTMYAEGNGSCSTWGSPWQSAPACSPGCYGACYGNYAAVCCRAREKTYNQGPCAAYYSSCNAYNTYYPAYSYVTYAAATYNASTPYSCNCTTGYTVKLIKDIAGTISTVATFSFAAAIASFRTILSGNTVTVRAFSGANFTSQIGSDQSQAVTGNTKTTVHGILKGPVTYSPAQTSDIDRFTVS